MRKREVRSWLVGKKEGRKTPFDLVRVRSREVAQGKQDTRHKEHMNLPNKLTVSRIVLTVIFMFLLFGHGVIYKVLAFLIFIVAAFTDFLDGHIAKKRATITDFGRFMDPIADKILTLSAFLAFVRNGGLCRRGWS